MFLMFLFLVNSVESIIRQQLYHIFLFHVLLFLFIWEVFLFDRERQLYTKEEENVESNEESGCYCCRFGHRIGFS